jgi:iron-sulfur cluster assembly accessory protein
VFESNGAKVVVDDLSFDFVKGATVDYVEEMIKSSFAIADNPNSQSSCGCGTSFVAK